MELVEEFRETYKNKTITYDDFSNILDQFARIDIRCNVEDNLKQQIYSYINQDGPVTYYAVEALIFEFLIQREIPPQKLIIDQDKLGSCAKRIPLDMLDSINNEFVLQFKNFYKLMANRYNQIVDYRELEKFCKELQRTIKINVQEILRYIQPFIDKQQKVKIADILELSNDLERLLNDQNRKLLQEPVKQQTIENVKQDEHLSSDEESKQSIIPIDRKIYINTIFQQTDLIKSKYLNKGGIQYLNEINKATQNLDALLNQFLLDIDNKNQKIDELLIEKELTMGQLQQFEIEIQNKDQQIQMCLQDNDFFQSQMNAVQEQYNELKLQLDQYNEQLKSITKIETELKAQQIDNRKLVEQLTKSQNEITRLTQNNKSLMQIIEELENNTQEVNQIKQAPKNKEQNKELIDHYEEKIHELQLLYQSLEEQYTSQEKYREGLELQIIDLKREITHYKKLYENTNIENQQLRSSIMPRASMMTSQQFNLGGLGRMSKVSIGGGSQKIFNIGRTSQQRFSSIRGNQQTVYSNFNPLEDAQNGGLKIEESVDIDQENLKPVQLRLQPRINSKYENSIVEPITEENEDKDQTQTVRQTEIINNKQNTFIQSFDKFWGGLKNKNLEELAPDPNCIQFDENILYQRDFLGIRDDAKVVEFLKIERNVHKSIIQRCFSDSVYRIDAKGKRARRIIFITEHTFYVFEGEKKPGKLSRQFALRNIHSMIFSETSPVLCCIKVAGSDDYLIETFKRSELNTYLTEVFSSQKIQLFRVDFLAKFKIKFKGIKEEIPIQQVSKRQGYLDQGKASAFKVSSKQGSYQPNVGWLQMYKKRMLSGDWQEVFAMLTNVGLILFKKPGDLEPLLFVSIVDAIVIKNPIMDTNKPHLIKIRYESSDFEFIFSTTSEPLLDQWHDIIQTTIMEQVRQQNKFLEFQQQQVVEHRTQALIEQFENSK